MKHYRTLSLAVICLVLGIMIAWQYSSVKNNTLASSYEKKRTEELVQELLETRNSNEKLQTRLDELRKEMDAYKSEETSGKDKLDGMKKDIQQARMIAGLTTVKGEGLLITIDNNGENVVEERHILEVLNELRASDVQAMAVNDERIVATSEVRKAGSYIMVNGRQLVSPYTIKAIGDPGRMERSLNLLGGVMEKLKLYDLNVKLERQSGIIIPSVRDDGTVLRVNLLKSVGP